MESATNPTEMGGRIAITVKDAAPLPWLSTWVRGRYFSRNYQTTHMKSLASHSISRILVFVLCLHNIFFMGALTKIRTQMTNENESAFEINENGVLMIVAIAVLFAVEIIFGILFFTNIPSTYYSILKFIGIFSASNSPFLLLMVLDTSPSMLYLLSYVFYGIAIAYVCSGNDDTDKDINKSSPISVFTYIGFLLVPLSLALVLFVPQNLDWFVSSVIQPIFVMEMIFFLIIYINFIFMIEQEKPEAQNFEAQHGIH
ncbi:hypothetical protein M8C21_003449 [Ambrosia artemisiifolia]|uniref:Uncharacterized protein n=1 Tax=Ambrosia artemisiifolia TaxID=4212 RepID=A0AAD5BSI6_AMBAR|nr:hypothetical protein M8C21_003449 [Ambrosia artemisiifolia]